MLYNKISEKDSYLPNSKNLVEKRRRNIIKGLTITGLILYGSLYFMHYFFDKKSDQANKQASQETFYSSLEDRTTDF